MTLDLCDKWKLKPDESLLPLDDEEADEQNSLIFNRLRSGPRGRESSLNPESAHTYKYSNCSRE